MKLFTLGLLVAATASLGVASPFTNGSFESSTGPFTPPAVFLVNGDTFVTGWVHSGVAGEFYTDGTAFLLAAGQGTYYVGFGAAGATGGSISQTFDTVAGTTYLVSYLLTTQENLGPLPDQIAQVEAYDGASLLASVSNVLNTPHGVWNSGLGLVFTATSSSTTLRITDLTPVGNSAPVNWGLDAVSVDAVPEPATFALVGLGLGFVGFLKRRRAL